MTIGPWPGEELVGKQVIVENGLATFVGKAVAVSDQPSILIEERDGARVMLPLANARLADDPTEEHTQHELWQEALEGARVAIDKVKPYAVVGTAESRMADVASFAETLSWARRNHEKRPWETTLDDLAVWQVHYDRAVRAYTDPFDQKGGPRV